MNILFVHNNFPGQFGSLAGHLAGARGHKVVAIGSGTARPIPGVELRRYAPKRGTAPAIHPFSVRFEADCIRGEATHAVATQLAQAGFRPDVIVGHVGWGEPLFLRDVWPAAKVALYTEFYYHGHGCDVGFDPEYESLTPRQFLRVRAKNATQALMLAEADLGISPTEWQRNVYPEILRPRISVVHDGIDTKTVRPRPGVGFKPADTGLAFKPGDEVITYVNRALEPMRGLHIFLQALMEILPARPNAHVLIVGADTGAGYGDAAPAGQSWKQYLLGKWGDLIDASRVHWLGRIERKKYLDVLAVSRVHVYLTYPFVLSWSLLEAMSAGCLVVASDTPPVKEVIEHECNGLLVDFHDRAALARTVIDALSQPREAFAAITQAARKTVIERYDRDSVCLPRWTALIEGLALKGAASNVQQIA